MLMLKIILDEGYKYLLVAIDIPTLNGVIRNDHAFITEPSVNKWKPLTLDQIDQQRELIKKYQKWYNQACVLIHELTPQREEEFKIYYENSSSKEGIIKTLKLENEFIGPVDKQKILENIIYWFTAQREIVSAIKIVLALRESVPIGPFSEEKEQNKSKLTPTQKLKIKNRFNQCEMSGCPNDPYEVHHIRWIEEGGQIHTVI